MEGLMRGRIIAVVVLCALAAVVVAVVERAGAASPPQTVEVTNASWTCSSTVDYDLVRVTINNGSNNDAIRLGQNCSGRIGRIEVTTNGTDGVKVLNSGTVAHDLVVESGFIRCTGSPTGSHQDGIQAMGGTDILFRHLRIFCGDGDDSVNAQFFVTEGGSGASTPTGIICELCVLGPDGSRAAMIGSESISSGLVYSVACPGDNFDIQFDEDATTPVDIGNQVVESTDPICTY
jgi:hypothetical protein